MTGEAARRTTGPTEFLVELFGLSGKVALVTGARHGIGRVIAVSLATAGADVAVTGRAATDLAPVLGQIHAAGRTGIGLELDVTDPAKVEACVDSTIAAFGHLDILVKNAGVTTRGSAIDLAAEEWSAVLATNLTGVFSMSRTVARMMRSNGTAGRIISLSSTFATRPAIGRSAYAASKAGLEQLTRVLALEWAPEITVNAIAPTAVVTETRAEVFRDPAARAARIAQIPMGRLSVEQDLVGAVLLLAGQAGSFITGETIVVDGGYSLG
jgi:NAD(P)-dependent dehydrogenase (short-subunit alcohol dehydrogenase family)